MNINGDMKPIDEGAGEDKQRKRLAFVLLFQGAMQRIVFILLKKVV